MPVGADPEHRASTIEGQIARVADIIAYVNHDIDDAVRAGILDPETLPADARRGAGPVVVRADRAHGDRRRAADDRRRDDRDPDERAASCRRPSASAASCSRRSTRTRWRRRSSRRPPGILGGLWERVREQPETFLDRRIDRGGGAGRRRPRLRRRHDRPLRRQPLRAALHSEALGFAEGPVDGRTGSTGCPRALRPPSSPRRLQSCVSASSAPRAVSFGSAQS